MNTVYDVIKKLPDLVASTLMFLVMAVTFVDVFGRNAVNRPLSGAVELTELLLGGVIFLALPKIAWRGRHINVDLVDAVAPKFVVKMLAAISELVCAGFFVLLSWRLAVLAGRMAEYGDATLSLSIPIAPVVYALSFLSAVSGMAHLAALVRHFVGREPSAGASVGEGGADGVI